MTSRRLPGWLKRQREEATAELLYSWLSSPLLSRRSLAGAPKQSLLKTRLLAQSSLFLHSPHSNIFKPVYYLAFTAPYASKASLPTHGHCKLSANILTELLIETSVRGLALLDYLISKL